MLLPAKRAVSADAMRELFTVVRIMADSSWFFCLRASYRRPAFAQTAGRLPATRQNAQASIL
jgi:hypothetical protein